MKGTAYINGKIFTSDKENLYADAMLVEDGIIKWIGSELNIPEGDYEYVDLKEARVLPGLIDAHMHPVLLAEFSKQIAALPPVIYSIEELIEEIKKVREKTKEDEWILGWGYDECKYSEKRPPNRYDLDKGCSDRPVSILRNCAHIRCVNSKALELAGINRNTPDPVGGEIERDENGEPTGILKENARNLVLPFIPAPSLEENIENLVDLSRLLTSQGIVAVADMGSLTNEDDYMLLVKAAKEGYKQKTAVYYMWDNYADDAEFQITREQMNKEAQIFAAGLKLIGDGSVAGQTAWMNRPYLGKKENYGMPVYTDSLVETAIDFCKKTGCQLSIHAMGARAIKRAVDRICQEEKWTKGNFPHVRIEHITDPLEGSIEKAAKHDIGFATQPIFMYAEIESYLNNLGVEWMKECYPVKHMLDRGVSLCFSTDAPATAWAIPSDPFSCIKGAVTRTAYDGTDCGQEQSVTIETAIELYTRESAKMVGFEKMGMLKSGYRADFIVLDRDIFEIPSEEIDQVKVLATYMKGCCEYGCVKNVVYKQ